jgi:hypothetical protein
MPSLIETLINSAGLKCTRCGAAMGNCACWERNVKLRCSVCKRTMMVCKDPTDPPGTAVVESPCDKCDNPGDKPETRYYDAQGHWFDGERFKPQ